ncbi:MAG: calcium/proton exchanger [Mycobacteriales bacterium]
MTDTGERRRAVGFGKGDVRLIAGCALALVAAGVTRYVGAGEVVPFVVSAIALAVLASLVGRSVEALGDRLGAGATGVVQSALGNLPELMVSLFALHAGLYSVVRASIVGSVLANVLLVLGLSFVVGGLRHGNQRFGAEAARTLSLLLVLAVLALLVPSLTASLHTPANGHEKALSVVVSVVLLALFALSLPASIRRQRGGGTAEPAAAPAEHGGADWSLPVALGMLAATGVGAALVSDWFVHALEPAMKSLGISQAFAGLVIVAIAGNAVENVVGVQLAAKNQADYALQVIMQSPLQIALVVAPVLVLVAPLVGASFTLVLPPLLIAALLMAVLVTVLVVLDGESNWLEGATLIALYAVIATAFWWG